MSKVSDEQVERAIVAYCDALKDISARLAFSDLHTHDRIAMRAALEAVSSIHEAEPVAWVTASLLRHHLETGNSQTGVVLHRSQGALNGESDIPLYAHPAPISKGVTVKAMEWGDEEHEAGFDIVARTTFGNYVINRDAISSGGAWNLWMAGETNDDISTCYDNLADAKAAAQSDFETRIRSCLSHTAGEPPPCQE